MPTATTAPDDTTTKRQPRPRRGDGVILADALYELSEIWERVGLGVHALRMARRAGLPVRYLGRKAFIVGRDLIAHVEAHGKTEK